jgi:hypothetical protein
VNRLFGLLVAISLLGVVAWALLREPPAARPAAPVAPVVAETRGAPPPPPPRTPVPNAPPSRPASVAAPGSAAAMAVAEALEKSPQGPFEYSLGRHTIHTRLETPRARLEVEAVIVTAQQETLREVARRRQELVRMMFFLGSHRAPAGLTHGGAREHFRKDLLARYRNVVRSGPVVDLRITHWEVEATE